VKWYRISRYPLSLRAICSGSSAAWPLSSSSFGAFGAGVLLVALSRAAMEGPLQPPKAAAESGLNGRTPGRIVYAVAWDPEKLGANLAVLARVEPPLTRDIEAFLEVIETA